MHTNVQLPLPLQVLATKKMPSTQAVFLVAVQIELVGTTRIRCYDMVETVVNKFVVVSNANLHIPLTKGPDDDVGTEVEVPNDIWRNIPLPNTVCPTFSTCNLSRSYALDIKLGLAWETLGSKGKLANGSVSTPAGHLPAPPLLRRQGVLGYRSAPEVLSAVQNRPPGKQQASAGPAPTPGKTSVAAGTPTSPSAPAVVERPPHLPPRVNSNQSNAPLRPGAGQPSSAAAAPAPPTILCIPATRYGGSPPYDDAPPSYDEAMASEATGPMERPAFSGVTTDVDGPSQIPNKGR
ncbi:unnamed protein product [Parascedosporium putredinis]|uniref:Uncharacterized protein n=1 Tax=Parascedosporium putredinis TaxID=1442378 RepID=A0A9P1H1Q6_9PEZI|nr:unnamed protein product [Parascedosporium putredinis]CAI7995400.1 unnamed protein product [Parascedosporium putredinis]